MNKLVNGILVPLTATEIAEGEQQEKIWQDQAYDRALGRLREKRNQLLAETDWIITKGLEQDMDLAEWKTYRQALRDLPATAEPQLNEFGNLTNVEWPTPPENS